MPKLPMVFIGGTEKVVRGLALSGLLFFGCGGGTVESGDGQIDFSNTENTVIDDALAEDAMIEEARAADRQAEDGSESALVEPGGPDLKPGEDGSVGDLIDSQDNTVSPDESVGHEDSVNPCLGHCSNQQQDCGELGVNCGGECAACAEILLEAEHFTSLGGWVRDQQFVDVMGSVYLLAHGMGVPVANASTTATFPKTGVYRLWVRTKDWTPGYDAGTFKVVVNGAELSTVFGTPDAGWNWQDGGNVTIGAISNSIALKDLTGFEGRCDALYFSQNLSYIPPNDPAGLLAWRRSLLGLSDTPPSAGNFDLVVVGGGIAGTSAALAAARLGLQVALIQDRPVLGGNSSQEVRVHTGGLPGRIVEEIDTNVPSCALPTGSDLHIAYDDQRQQVVEAEPNITLFMPWRAFRVQKTANRITSVDAFHTESRQELRFLAPVFLDSTGDGWIGFWSGADYRMGREAKSEYSEPLAPDTADTMTLGTSLLWESMDAQAPTSFPNVPWALAVSQNYAATRGEWFWEYGMEIDTIYDAEEIRDHLMVASYGAFYNAHQENPNLKLKWVAFVAGKRESRRLLGDYVLKEQDILNKVSFPDTVVIGSWPIDLHYPDPFRACYCNCANKIIGGVYNACPCASQCSSECGICFNLDTRPDGAECPSSYCADDHNCPMDFLSQCRQQGQGTYQIPYRSLYSRNIENLFLAGRDISATHVGLGGPRVMSTSGQMGVAVGTAAYLCKTHQTLPRGVYQNYLPELLQALTSGLAISQPAPILMDHTSQGVTISKGAADKDWKSSTYATGCFCCPDYIHSDYQGSASKFVTFTPNLPLTGAYAVFVNWNAPGSYPDPNQMRADNVPVDITYIQGTERKIVNQLPQSCGQFVLLDAYYFRAGTSGSVVIGTEGTVSTETVIVDSVKFSPVILMDNNDTVGVDIVGKTLECNTADPNLSWRLSASVGGFVGPDYLTDCNSTGAVYNKAIPHSVKFTPYIPASRTYNVYLSWTSGTNRDTHVPVDIRHAGTTTTVYVDQQPDTGKWHLLGAYAFQAGQSDYVQIGSAGTTQCIIVDAVLLEPQVGGMECGKTCQ